MALKQSLDNAKTPEEKRAVIDQWRQQNQALMSQRMAAHPAKSQQQDLAARQQAIQSKGGSPEPSAKSNP